MNTEEAKKIAEAIVLCVAAAYGKGRTVGELKQKCVEILTTEPAAPVEKEYRAGEWVPKLGQKYLSVLSIGKLAVVMWDDDEADNYRLSQGNVFPSEAIAEAAKKHAEFWRAFDMDTGGGSREIIINRLPYGASFDILTGRVSLASAWVGSHGGEAYVSEMLTKGRVFRFKWGGE